MTKSSFYPGTDYDPVDPPAPAPAPPGSGNDAAPSSFFKGSLAYDAVDESDFVGPPGPTGPVGPTGPAGGVASVFARTGAVVAVSGDYTATQITNTPAGAIAAATVQAALNELDTEKAPLASPTFTGAPAGPTAAPGTNTTQFSTTAFVKAAIDVVLGGVSAAFDTLSEIVTELALKATLASPTFTGTPAAPTAAAATNTTQLATTAFVKAEIDSLLRGHLHGLGGSTAGSSTTMTIAPGQATSDDFTTSIILASAIAKTTSSWAVGTTNGGLDAGSIAATTWYHFYEIKRLDTGVVDVLFSLNASSPTMPTNYTKKRRIFSWRTNASSQWETIVQDGDLFQWGTVKVDVLAANATNPGTSAVLRTLSVPTGLNVIACLQAGFSTSVLSSNPAGILLSDPAVPDAAPSVGAASVLNYGVAGTCNNYYTATQCRTNTSAQVRSRLQISNSDIVLNINTTGWIDRRGRD